MFGARLLELREARGLELADAAAALKIGKPALVMIEKGTRYPSTRLLYAMSRLYMADANELLRLLAEERPPRGSKASQEAPSHA